MRHKLSVAKAKIVVQWDSGEARFITTRSAQIFINKVCKRITPGKDYGILGVIYPPVGF